MTRELLEGNSDFQRGRMEQPHDSLGSPARVTHPFRWSVQREVWENRFVYLAPLIVASVVLFASLVGTLSLPRKVRTLATSNAPQQQSAIYKPFAMAPAPIMLASFIVGLFYAADALHGERRDRSILFWKSLPVSDRTTVLAKAAIPVVVLPLIAFALSVAVHSVMLIASTLWLTFNGMSPAHVWDAYPFVQAPVVMIYGLAVHALWFAPIYCWLMLASAWARRTPLLWGLLPMVTIAAVERIVFGSKQFVQLLQYRVSGAMKEGFGGENGSVDRIAQLTPGTLLTSAGFWVGLMFAAACLVASIRLRRYREAI